MGGKRRGDVKVPEGFVKHVKSDEFKELIKQVWQRIPAAERGIIEERLSGIYPADLDRPTEGRMSKKQVLAGVAPILWFVSHDIELGSQHAHMWIDQARLNKYSDPAIMAVIAHEFAHVFLNHPCYQKASEWWGAFEPLTAAAIEVVHDWDADLQTFLWGFQPELRALLKERHQKYPAWLLTPECGQPLTEKTTEEAGGDKTEIEGG